MLDGQDLARILLHEGITDVVWIPDSELGRWDAGLRQAGGLRLIRVAREGEAIAVAGGLWLGGASPLVILQCTGLFEAGDALRNILFDLRIPLPLLIGVRSYRSYTQGRTRDTCPGFTEPILRAWGLPCDWAATDDPGEPIRRFLRTVRQSRQPRVLLWPEE